MSWLNSSLAAILPYVPRWFARPFAGPYVAGETTSQALDVVRSLNARGFKATVDILGEHVRSREEAAAIRDAYRHLYDRINEAGLDSNISLKLTHLGLEIDPEIAKENVLLILEKAREFGNFLRIDMENSPHTDETIRIYGACRKSYPGVGVVLQAYLKRTLADIQTLTSPAFNCRVCKGIYRESPDIAYKEPEAINQNYITAVQNILNGGGYVAIATHDLPLIDSLVEWLTEAAIPANRFEFQVLYGVPMYGKLEDLLERGFTVRIYVPFGRAWFDYSVRRLKENPRIIGYIFRNLINRWVRHE